MMAMLIKILTLTVMFNIYSLNCNGLRNMDKIKNVFSILEQWNSDIVLLQETFWTDSLMAECEKQWKGKIFYNNNENRKCGVAILVKNCWKDVVECCFSDNSGRIIGIKIKIEEKEIVLMSIYAPNNNNERVTFFQNLDSVVGDNVVIGGDFNTSLSQKDRHNTIHKPDKPHDKLKELICNKNLYDVWRDRNPYSRHFSWKRVINNQIKMSRIDFFLIDKTLTTHVKNIFYKETTFSDHSFVFLQLDFSTYDRGPGVWIFNNTYLNDDDFCEKITKLVDKEKQCILYQDNMLLWWDNLKYRIKKISQLYGRERKKIQYEKINRIQRKFQNFKEKIAHGIHYDIIEYEDIKNELAKIEIEKCQGAILRSKAQWAIEGDKNTKYFLNLENYKQRVNSITELETGNGELITENEQIQDEEYKYYSSMYNNVQTEEKDIDEFLKYVNKTLDKTQKEICDGKIDKTEILTALNSMSRNKSPGSDGLTVEFYMKFWSIFDDIFFQLFECIFNEEKMSRSMRLGHITLIYKKKGNKNKLKNWRPINLLNVDYKILSRIMSNRLKSVLPHIISPEQTACVIRRDIADTIVTIKDIIDISEIEKSEGYLLKIDQEKAFDRVSHNYLFKVLEAMGFGNIFCKWIRIFYTDIYSAVKSNGHVTKYFPVKNSVRQGCPISAMLFVITAEPLNMAIKSHTGIQGISIPFSGKESLIYQHADDTSITVANKDSIHNTFKVFEKYGKASGAKVNISKSEVLCLGKGFLDKKDLSAIPISLCNDVVQMLGIYIGKNVKQCEEMNWAEKVDKIKHILNIWRQRHLNLNGRAIVISNLLLSRIWYTLTVQPLPEWVEHTLRSSLLEFLWQKKAHPVKYSSIINDKKNGGLNIPDITLKMKSFRLKYMKRYIQAPDDMLWKHTMSYFFRLLGNLNYTKECLFLKYNKRAIDLLPKYYQEMLYAWNDLKQNFEYDLSIEQIYNQPLFYNPEICYKNKCLFFDTFVKAGITKMKDICYEFIPGFLSTRSIIEIISEALPDTSESIIEKEYCIVRHSIPYIWNDIVNKNTNTNNFEELPIFMIYLQNKMYTFSEMQTSSLYKALRLQVVSYPTSYNFWETKFQNIKMDKLAELIQLDVKYPDMKEIDFKIYHNIIYTQEKLFKMRLVDSNRCQFCNKEIEDILHVFISCTRVENFKQFLLYHIENLLQRLPNEVINELNFDEMILLGFIHNSNSVNYTFVNFMLSIARLSIYKTWKMFTMFQKKVDVIIFFKYLFEKYIEYSFYYYENRGDFNYFQKKFVHNNPIIKIVDNKLKIAWV